MQKILLALSLSAAFLLTGCYDQYSYSRNNWQPPVTNQAESYSQRRPASPIMHGLPANYEEFKNRYASMGRTPQGAVKLYFDAVFSYIEGNRAEAMKMIRYSMHEGKGWERTGYHSTFMERLNNPKYHHIFRSFAVGSSPENDYAMNPQNYRLAISGQREMHGYVQVLLISSGSESLRSVQVRQHDDGLWYVMQNAATYTQVQDSYSQRAQRMYEHDADYD